MWSSWLVSRCPLQPLNFMQCMPVIRIKYGKEGFLKQYCFVSCVNYLEMRQASCPILSKCPNCLLIEPYFRLYSACMCVKRNMQYTFLLHNTAMYSTKCGSSNMQLRKIHFFFYKSGSKESCIQCLKAINFWKIYLDQANSYINESKDNQKLQKLTFA